MRRLLSAIVLAMLACGDSVPFADPSDPAARKEDDVPGSVVKTSLSAEQQADLDAIQAQLDAVKGVDAAGFAAKYAVPFTTTLGYDPLAAKGLELVQASPLALGAAEQAALGSNGFVITDKRRFPSFVCGYESIYAVHESFDAILKFVEGRTLVPTLDDMLATMRARSRQAPARISPPRRGATSISISPSSRA